MMKKGFILLLVLTVAIAVSACGAGSSSNSENKPAVNNNKDKNEPVSSADEDIVPEEGAKLLVWDGKDGVPFLKEIAKEFTAKYGIPVEVEDQGGPEQLEKMKTDGPAELAADIITQPHNDLGNAVKSGFVLPNDFYEEQTKAEFLPAAVEAVTFDGMLYGYPRNMETYALFINQDLVGDAPIHSWEDIIAFSKTFNDVKNNKYGFMSQLTSLYWTYPYFSGYGGYIFGNKETDPADIGLNNEGSVQGMKFFQSLREILPMASADATDDIKRSLFQDGKLAINLDGVWNIGEYSKLKYKVTMIPLPAMPGSDKEPVTLAGVKAYYVSAYSKYPNAAKLFARYATTKEALLKNFEISGFIPARLGMESEAAIQSNEMVKAALKQLENSQPMPTIIEMGQVWTPVEQALELIWNGEDVKQSLDKAVEDIKTGILTQDQ
ncbi:maltose ABC transporter substrate-binding protein [Paenibacillus oenotherae]|uniref:Maltose ABC transporter substrate-binding protein n=1 Tax=Paenibacillus oenotherae TaxID=1435645 RepID=A0ABS7DAL7_9BACL|nr:maltose ABC transporter substrate-binding protein [Paenibacillus oenotherae]MBW7476803.1 maltose ABC transporter substrate-binding protein [Paenibacillus oenotherae]